MDRRLPADYNPRLDNTHFIDAPTAIVHQHQVYAFLRYLLQRSGCKRVIDIGCGSAEKLKGLDPTVEIVCLDAPVMRPFVAANVPHACFIECDLEQGLPELRHLLADAIVVCSDVVEHLRMPEILLRELAHHSKMAAYVLLSTPDRVRARGLLDMGPPGNGSHTMEWSADELGRFLQDCAFSPAFLGYTENNNVDRAKNTILALGGREAMFTRNRPPLSVAAIINVYNEEDVIDPVVRYLHGQGVAVHLVDNWSTDNTWNRAEALQREGLCANILRYPDRPSGEYAWAELLQHTARYAAKLHADWIIHYDADEYRSSPWRSSTLAEAITFVDSLGYSAIDFTVLNFAFTDTNHHANFSPDRLRFFDFGRHGAHLAQVKAWKNSGQLVDLASSAGHVVTFPGARVYPLKFLTRHYPFRSAAQAATKVFQDRLPRIQREKRERGWHNHYDTYSRMSAIRPWRTYELLNFDPNVFEAEFLVERLSGVGIETDDRGLPNLNTVFDYLEKTEIEREQAATALSQSGKEMTELREANRRLQNELSAMRNSRSWKVSAPLRELKRQLFSKRR